VLHAIVLNTEVKYYSNDPDWYIDYLSLRRGANEHVLLLVENFCTLQDLIEITNGKPRQNSVLWIAAECHCQVADFLLHI
jgi:hypothetical protein